MQQPLCYKVCEYILWQKLPPEFYCKSIWGHVESKTKKTYPSWQALTRWLPVSPGAEASPELVPTSPHSNKLLTGLKAQQNGNDSRRKLISKNFWGLFVERILVSSSSYNILQPHVLLFFKAWLMCIGIFCTVLHWSTHCWFHFAKLHHFGHRSWGCCLVTLKRSMSRGIAVEL